MQTVCPSLRKNQQSVASSHCKWRREEIAAENGRISNTEGLVTLILDRVILQTVVHHSSTSTYMPNFIEIEETFCGRTDVRIHGRTLETGFIRTTLSKSRPKSLLHPKVLRSCDQSVCMFVCLSSCISQKHISKLHKIFCTLQLAVARFSSDDNAKLYVLPVLWMTSCFHIAGHAARCAGNIDLGAVLQQVVINFQRIRQGAPLRLTLSSYIT